MLLKSALLAAASLSSSALAAFGVTKSGSDFVVDAGSSNALIFTVNGANCDITSIKYRGEEFQYASKGSHISSGLGSATVSSAIIGESTFCLPMFQVTYPARLCCQDHLHDIYLDPLLCRKVW